MAPEVTKSSDRFGRAIVAAAGFPEIRRPEEYTVLVEGSVKSLPSSSGSDHFQFRAELRQGTPSRLVTSVVFEETYGHEHGSKVKHRPSEEIKNRLLYLASAAKVYRPDLETSLSGNTLEVEPL